MSNNSFVSLFECQCFPAVSPNTLTPAAVAALTPTPLSSIMTVSSILSELSFTLKEKTKIVLNDYLNVAKNFVPINEVKMINAVVDKYLNDKQIL